MILTERHVELLKHIHSYATIKRYHGMLPRKEAAVYDTRLIDYLVEQGLVEEGVIITTCGSNPKGFRLAEGAEDELSSLGIDFGGEEWRQLKETRSVTADGLEREHIDLLMDIYHFSKIKKFHGIAPRFVLDPYDKEVIKFLYDTGYIFYIKLKGSKVNHEKGYVLSDKASRLLEQAGCMN